MIRINVFCNFFAYFIGTVKISFLKAFTILFSVTWLVLMCTHDDFFNI